MEQKAIKHLRIELPNPLHEQLKILCVRKGTTIKQFTTDLLIRTINEESE